MLDEAVGVAGMQFLAALVLGLLAYAIGRERAFHHQQEAQNTLCRLRLADATRQLLEAKRKEEIVQAVVQTEPTAGPEESA